MFYRSIYLFSLLLFALLPGLSSPAAASGDSFLAGYVTAVLQRDFHIDQSRFSVNKGVVSIDTAGLAGYEVNRIVRELSAIEGVRGVETGSGTAYASGENASARPEINEEESARNPSIGGRTLFEPLIADPLWPRFAVSRGFFTDGGNLKNVVLASVGDTLPLYTDDLPFGSWQFVTFAMVDTINDLDTSSWDLINADFTFGVGFAHRRGDVSGLLRLLHLSSHAGDEYVINSGAERVSLSYQSADITLSYDVRKWLRAYGGGAYRFSTTPKDLEPLELRYGLEISSPGTYFGFVRPLAAVNMHHTQERDWEGAVSVRAGVEIDPSHVLGHSFRLTAGYYDGPSHFGQFYKHYHEYFDLGVQMNF